MSLAVRVHFIPINNKCNFFSEKRFSTTSVPFTLKLLSHPHSLKNSTFTMRVKYLKFVGFSSFLKKKENKEVDKGYFEGLLLSITPISFLKNLKGLHLIKVWVIFFILYAPRKRILSFHWFLQILLNIHVIVVI